MTAGTKIILAMLVLITLTAIGVAVHTYLSPKPSYYFRWTGRVYGPYLSQEDCDYTRDWTLDLKDRSKAKDFAPCEPR